MNSSLEEIEENYSSSLQFYIYNKECFAGITPSTSKFLYFVDGMSDNIQGPVSLPSTPKAAYSFLSKRYHSTRTIRRDIPVTGQKLPTEYEVKALLTLQERVDWDLVPSKYVLMMVFFYNAPIKDLDFIIFPVRWYSSKEIGSVLSRTKSVVDMLLSTASHLKQDEHDTPLKRFVGITDLDTMD